MTLLRMPASAPRADLVEQPEERLAPSEPAHRPQQRRRRVLERDVEVGDDAGHGGHRVEQARADLGRLQVADADPLDPGDSGEVRQDLLEQPEVAEVLAVGGGVLADQEELLDAALPQPAGLRDDVVRSPRDEGAAEHRDGAERASAVTAAGDLQRRPRAAVEPGPDDARSGGGDRPSMVTSTGSELRATSVGVPWPGSAHRRTRPGAGAATAAAAGAGRTARARRGRDRRGSARRWADMSA